MKFVYEYDVAIVGAGPAGLSAARSARRFGLRTILLEKHDGPGELDHPCGCVIAPVPGFVSMARQDGSLHLMELDLTIPRELIRGQPTRISYISPHDYEIRAEFGEEYPTAAIDKPGLLRLLATRAEAMEAKMLYNTRVMGLLEKDGLIVGVRTESGDITARVTLAAEGVNRLLCLEAGLYPEMGTAPRYAFVITQQLEAPAAREEHVGQVTTFGQRYSSARNAYGTVMVDRPGHLNVYFTIIGDKPTLHTEESLNHYLDEYKRNDPRVCSLFERATIIARGGCRMVIREAPARATRPGFIGIGDSASPGGHVGVLPAMALGWHAAEVAANAIHVRDFSAHHLEQFNHLYFWPMLRGVETEGRIMLSLASMDDDEIDRACQTLGDLNLAPFFYGHWPTAMWESMRWSVTHLSSLIRDQALLRRIVKGT